MACDFKNHELVEIRRYRIVGDDAFEVVNWCSHCGAIVIDTEYDGRLFAGKVVAMKHSTLAREAARKR